MSTKRYTIYIEGDEKTNFSAYAPALPGCASTGKSVTECEQNMREAIALHLEGLARDGEQVPEAFAVETFVEVKKAA